MSERLQKYLASAGVASRRHAEELITAGRVAVNNTTVTELGTKVTPGTDLVTVDGKLVAPPEEKTYLLLYKPTGVVTTLEDPQERATVKHYLGDFPQRVFPVGRLDYDAEGALLLTDDGELAHKLTHPSFQVPRTYLAKVKGTPDEATLEKLRGGVRLEDGLATPKSVDIFEAAEKNTWLKLVVTEGRQHLIKRMCAAVGHPVVRLYRPSYGGVGAQGLRPGEIRALTKEEVRTLNEAAEGKGELPVTELRLPPRRHGHGPAGFEDEDEGGESASTERPVFAGIKEGGNRPPRRTGGAGREGGEARGTEERGLRKTRPYAVQREDARAGGERRPRRDAEDGEKRPRAGARGGDVGNGRSSDGEGRAARPARGGFGGGEGGERRPARGGFSRSEGGGFGGERRPARGGFGRSEGGAGGDRRPARGGFGRGEGGEGGERRPARGGFGGSEGGERRPAHGGFGRSEGSEGGERRPARGGFGRSEGGERRPARGGFGRSEGGERRPARGGFGGGEGGERRPSRGGFGGSEGGERRPARGSFGRGEGGEQRPARGGFGRGEGGGFDRERRPARGGFGGGEGGERRPARGGFGGSEGGERRPARGGFGRSEGGGFNRERRPARGGFGRGEGGEGGERRPARGGFGRSEGGAGERRPARGGFGRSEGGAGERRPAREGGFNRERRAGGREGGFGADRGPKRGAFGDRPRGASKFGKLPSRKPGGAGRKPGPGGPRGRR